jgi:hypothetical protein
MTQLEDIDREKEYTDYTDEEKQVIRDNAENLSDTDKEVFKPILEEKEDEKQPLTFKDEEELNTYLDKREKQKAEETERLEQEEEERKKQYPFFEPNEPLPKDWNEAMNRVYPKFKERMTQEQQEELKKRREEIDKINKQFDEEIETLRKTNESIPEAGTDDRKVFDQELSKIAVKYNLTTMTEAYNLKKAFDAQKQTESKDTETETPPPTPSGAGAPQTQTQTARRVGRSGGTKGSGTKKYSDIAGKTMDELLEEEGVE